MRNPFRSEAEAYRFVIATALYFAAVVAATAVGGRWWGLGVFGVLTIPVLAWFFHRETRARPPVEAHRKSADGERGILVIANETVGGSTLRDEIKAAAGEDRARVLVVTPALNSPLKHWVSDEDGARNAAEERLRRSIADLERQGVSARGEVGDADPLQAIEDALRTFGADRIIISTHPEGRSNWLEKGVVKAAQERFALPITHVVVDLEAESRTPTA